MEDRVLSQTYDEKLEGIRVIFNRDVNAISADENNKIPRIKIPKGTVGILTGGESKKADQDRICVYFMVKTSLFIGKIMTMHLVSVRFDHLRLSLDGNS